MIAEQVEEAMLGRRTRLDTRKAEAEAEPVRKLFKFERDLAKQIRQLLDRLHETKRDLRLDPENVQKVVEVALELAGQPTLVEAKVPGLWPDPKRSKCPVFRLPALSGSWEQCAEGLAHPFTGEARPFVFDHALAKGREDVVLVHLNHRLVQMSLRLLRAEVWSLEGQKKRLNRVTARVVPDSALQHLAVVAHARLVVIGGDSQRLHEEIITAGGPIREGRFSRFGSLKEMQDVLAAATDEEPSEPVKEKLLRLWRDIAEPLHQALEARTKDRTDGLKKTARRAGRQGGVRHHGDPDRVAAGDRGPTGRPVLPAELPARLRPRRAGAVRAERRCPAAPVGRDPRRDREGDRGDPGTVRRPAAPDVSGGGDISGATEAREGGAMMSERERLPDEAQVVRCGRPPFDDPKPLHERCDEHDGVYGFSVQSRGNQTLEALAVWCLTTESASPPWERSENADMMS